MVKPSGGAWGSRRYLVTKHMASQSSATTNWMSKISFKYQTLKDAEELMEEGMEDVRERHENSKAFMESLLNISKYWNLFVEKSQIYAMLCSSQVAEIVGEVHKALISNQPGGVKIQLHPTLNNYLPLSVQVKSPVDFPRVNLHERIEEFEELQRGEELIEDAAMMSIISNEVGVSSNYSVHQFDSKRLKLRLKGIPEIRITLSFSHKDSEPDYSKFLLKKLFKESIHNKTNLLETFIKHIAHLHFKLLVYSKILETMENSGTKYELLEAQKGEFSCVYRVAIKQSLLIAEVHINQVSLKVTIYEQRSNYGFVPKRPLKEITPSQLPPLINLTLSKHI